MRYTKKPGSSVHKGVDEKNSLLLSSDKPDTICIPSQVAKAIGVGEGHTECIDMVQAKCICGSEHIVNHYITEKVQVAECPYKGFLWYRRR